MSKQYEREVIEYRGRHIVRYTREIWVLEYPLGTCRARFASVEAAKRHIDTYAAQQRDSRR